MADVGQKLHRAEVWKRQQQRPQCRPLSCRDGGRQHDVIWRDRNDMSAPRGSRRVGDDDFVTSDEEVRQVLEGGRSVLSVQQLASVDSAAIGRNGTRRLRERRSGRQDRRHNRAREDTSPYKRKPVYAQFASARIFREKVYSAVALPEYRLITPMTFPRVLYALRRPGRLGSRH